MDTELIVLIINLVVTIVAFLFGRYILPKHKDAILSATMQLDLLFKQAEYFVSYARKFLNCSGAEKMNTVVKKLADFCALNKIDIDEETIRAICQKAYDSMILGESKVILKADTIESPIINIPESVNKNNNTTSNEESVQKDIE